MDVTKGLNGKAVPEYFAESRAETSELVNKSGLKLQRYTWPAALEGKGARGVLLAIHGVSSHILYEWLCHTQYPEGSDEGAATGYEGVKFHSPKYEGSWVQAMNAIELTVTGIDQQSYGLSQGARGLDNFFEQFEDLVDDQLLLLEKIASEYPGLPVFVMGESMGGCVATRVCERADLAGAVMLAPMLSLEQLKKKPINKVLLPISGLMSRIGPTLRLAQKEPHIWKEQHQHYVADPLNESVSIRCRVARECILAVDSARDEVQRFRTPLLVMHSLNDTMCDPHGSQFLFDNASSTDKTIELLDDEFLWHALPIEPGNGKVLRAVKAWLLARLAPVAGEITVSQE